MRPEKENVPNHVTVIKTGIRRKKKHTHTKQRRKKHPTKRLGNCTGQLIYGNSCRVILARPDLHRPKMNRKGTEMLGPMPTFLGRVDGAPQPQCHWVLCHAVQRLHFRASRVAKNSCFPCRMLPLSADFAEKICSQYSFFCKENGACVLIVIYLFFLAFFYC